MSEASDPYGTAAFWARKARQESEAMAEDEGETVSNPVPIVDGASRPILRDEKGRVLPGAAVLNPWGRHGKKGGDVRQQLGRSFLHDLKEAWEERGAQVLRRLAVEDPAAFANVVAKVLPKEIRLTDDRQGLLEQMGVEALAALRDELREAVALARRGVPVQIPPSLEALTHERDETGGAADPAGSEPG